MGSDPVRVPIKYALGGLYSWVGSVCVGGLA